LAIVNVKGARSGLPPRKIRATSRSFQTHMNWKMKNEANDGTDKGRTILKKKREWEAPSIWADSNKSDGREPKTVRNR